MIMFANVVNDGYYNSFTIFFKDLFVAMFVCMCFVVEGIGSIGVLSVCMCPEEGQKGTSNRKASGALPVQGLLETDFTRPSVQKKPSFW